MVIGIGWAVSYYFNNPFILVIAVVVAAMAAVAWAAEVSESEMATAIQPVSKQTSMKKKVRRRARPGEKETEGTEAPNRFKADTVIWSPYRLNGKPLEVDPD